MQPPASTGKSGAIGAIRRPHRELGHEIAAPRKPRGFGTAIALALGTKGKARESILQLLDFAPWRLGPYCTAQSVGTPTAFYLSSHFQAIFGVGQRRPVGYEALIRATRTDGLPIAPPQLLGSVPEGEARAEFDRQCNLLQVEKFIGLGDAHSRLFLNLDPYVAVEGRRFAPFFAQMLESHNFPADRVAVELTESPLQGMERLASAVDYYRELGCQIVIDDFGAGHSNFDRISRLKPHIVKIDQGMTRHVTTDPVARRMFTGVVSVLHDVGALVCVEGIETEHQALCAIDASADLLQGFYLARPAETLVAEDACRDVFDHLREVSARRPTGGNVIRLRRRSSGFPPGSVTA